MQTLVSLVLKLSFDGALKISLSLKSSLRSVKKLSKRKNKSVGQKT